MMLSESQSCEQENPRLNEAIRLAELGYRVFPLQPNSKKPLKGGNGCNDATTDVEQIEKWWFRNPDFNIGLSTDGLLVIDLDPGEQWSTPEKEYELSVAPIAETPRGGRHYIFRQHHQFRNTSGSLSEFVDTRADGGYIVLCPSYVDDEKSTGSYKWIQELDCTPDKLPLPPQWLIDELDRAATSKAAGAGGESEDIPDGQRNARLTSIGGHLRRCGLSQNAILQALKSTNQERCKPPLDDEEVRIISRSVASYDPDNVTKALAENEFNKTFPNGMSDEFLGKSGQGDLSWKPFPTELFPEPFAGFIADCSTLLGCDPSMVALPLLASWAGLIGNAYRVKVKSKWTEPAVIWSAIIAPPGAMKSPAQNESLSLIRRVQDELRDEWNRKMEDYEIAVSEADDKEGPKNPPVKPTLRRCVASDITVEALVSLLEQNPKGLLIAHDELSGFFKGMGQYKTTSGDQAAWLSMWGAGPITVDRKTSPKPLFVSKAAVSICGGIQPKILERCIAGENTENGMAARFLLVEPPIAPKRWVDGQEKKQILERMQKLFRLASDVQFGLEPREVELGTEAQHLMREFVNDHGVVAFEQDEQTRGAFSKLEAYCARFALLFHLVGELENQQATWDIQPENMQRAIDLTKWFRHEATRVYKRIGNKDEEAIEIIDLIAQSDEKAITARELRAKKRKYRASGAAEEVLERQVRAGILEKFVDKQPQGRPATRYRQSNC